MSGISIIGFAVGGAHLAVGLGTLLALDPAEAAARNDRIRHLTEQRRDRRVALETASARAADERERLAQALVRARVDAAGAAAALAAAGLPPDPGLTPPADGPAVAAWCGQAPALVRAAHQRAGSATAGQAVRQLAALLADLPTASPVTAADLLTPQPPGPDAQVRAVLERMLSTLDARVGAPDREAVQAVAEAAARRADRAAHLVQLRLRIQEANDRTARRHDDAVVAAQLLDAMTPYRPEHGLDPDRLDGARAALAEVVAFRRDLDDGLLDVVARLREQVETRASALTVTDAVADVLGELGYLVGPDFSVGEATEGMLEISHPGRPDHLVRMRVDPADRQLVTMVYRAGGVGEAEADTAVEAAWCGDLDRAVGQLAGSGLALTPVVLTAPGSRPTPAVGGQRDDRERTRRQQRTNPRPEQS